MPKAVFDIDLILTVFIDPERRIPREAWTFVHDGSGGNQLQAVETGTKDSNVVLTFGRKSCLGYFWCRLKLFLTRQKVRNVLYVNDGLMSSFFDANNLAAYRYFVRRHLPCRRNLEVLLPTWRAERRYLVFEQGIRPRGGTSSLANYDFLMYSNPGGKLILTTTETLRTGKGEVLKTTANPAYIEVLQKEFLTVQSISARIKGGRFLPGGIDKVDCGSTFFLREEYISGSNLMDVLTQLAITRSDKADKAVKELIERLDAWYATVLASSSGDKMKVSVFYFPVLERFSTVYARHPVTNRVVAEAKLLLSKIDDAHPGLVPVVAHNDLWPANFMIHGENIIAIDWERATSGCSGIFDYFWMMISLCIVYLKVRDGLPDYGQSFRRFLAGSDIVSLAVHVKLKTHLERNGFVEIYQFFMLLFLIEWSIQGWTCLGRQTPMDQLAFQELFDFLTHSSCLDRMRGVNE